VCAYAINQHSVGEELGAPAERGAPQQDTHSAGPSAADASIVALRRSPFYRAIMLTQGTVSIVDHRGEVFRRCWCGYELYVSVVERTGVFLHDVLTVVHGVAGTGDLLAVGLLDGYAADDMCLADRKSAREAPFPRERIQIGQRFVLAETLASVQSDKDTIVNAVGDAAVTLDRTVRARFGAALLGNVLAAEAGSEAERILADTLVALRGSALHRLHIILPPGVQVSAERADALAAAFPASLSELRVLHAAQRS
jgi:hypothetical protein